MDNVQVLSRTTVTGYYDYNFLVANERVSEHLGPTQSGKNPKERLWKIRARQVVLATGSIERPMVFADNDRPGVMLASAIRTYVNQYAVCPGKQIVILTNNDSAYHAAIDSSNAGGIHGLDHEHEDIEVVVISEADAQEAVRTGAINNAMSVIALQWLALNKQSLLQRWG